jgi:membrane protein YdbS with pleckstrin-like domain
MNKGMKSFFISLAVFLPLCLLTAQWRVLQILILLLFLVYGVGFFFLKEFKKYIPFSAAFLVALCSSIFIYPLI